MNIAEKVIRIDADAYDFIVDFANQYDLKIGEAVSILIRYCTSKGLKVKQAHVEVVEVQNVVEDDD